LSEGWPDQPKIVHDALWGTIRLRKLSDLFPLDYWSTLYRNHKWHRHVFCPPEYQQAVYDAAKAVFKRKYGLQFEKSAGEMSHVRKP